MQVKNALFLSTRQCFVDFMQVLCKIFKYIRLQELDEHDRARLAKAKAKNSLESFIIETREKLYTDEYEKASTEDERAKIQQALSSTGDWLEYESDDASTEVRFIYQGFIEII